MSFERPTMTTPKGSRISIDYSTEPPTEIYDSFVLEKDDVFDTPRCIAAGLEDSLVDAWTQLGSPTDRVGFMKFGDAVEGTLALFPGPSYCEEMETRSSFEPWFVYGATGPKYIVILLDRSISMALSRFRKLKDAAARILSGLTEEDFATVMVYDTEVAAVSNSLARITDSERADFLEWLEKQSPGQTPDTNYEEALKKAYGAFDDCVETKLCKGCQRVILFITDGEPSVGKEDQSLMESSLFAGGKYRILTYSHDAGDGEHVTEYCQRLACQNDGIHFRSAGGSTWRGAESLIGQYYQALVPPTSDMAPTRWIKHDPLNAYLQHSGHSGVWSGCKPAVAGSVGNEKLVGVMCVDLNLFVPDGDLSALPDWAGSMAQSRAQSTVQWAVSNPESCVSVPLGAGSIRQSVGTSCSTSDEDPAGLFSWQAREKAKADATAKALAEAKAKADAKAKAEADAKAKAEAEAQAAADAEARAALIFQIQSMIIFCCCCSCCAVAGKKSVG
jgi:hypothetical protein